MPSTLILDRSDPGVDQLVSNWKDGQTYNVTLTILQTKSGPNSANYEVTGIEAEEAETETEMPPEEMPAGMKRMPMKGMPPAAVEY